MIVALNRQGGKVRPIALGEASTKLAQAVLVDVLARDLRAGLEPRQLSVRTPSGAELLARTLRGWMADGSGRVLLQLDLKNAYGRMHRSTALAAMIRRCPGLAPQLAQQ